MKPAFEVKSARLDVLSVQLHTADLGELEEFLQQRVSQHKELDSMLFLLDLQEFSNPGELSIAGVVSLFARYGLQIIGLRHENEAWAPHAQAYHLAFSRNDSKPADPQPKPAAQPAAAAPAAESVQATVISKPTVLINTPIRTGQQVYAENADLIVTGIVNEGAEIIADGNIHVYGTMRGRALAGATGNRDARIFIQSMQAELVSVAGIYRNFDQSLPDHLNKKAVQVSLQDNRLVISAIDGQ
ncbi:septum site-determining protein MinC [Neisseria dumasiana]|uniref:Probable septum site-determining protein MinC n=1 Tax=Neisseria dumasiana TaxID=1931275 RepID=A0A1X3DJP8_9NEIS|nr:septum site-determining protein MinC [Neisseria dumasiana]OSI17359.1 septum site-determining protein MinC [Neisseria dumasiana]OSI23536.1 septum site-determining protein MinC [Neisseria dumasiana]OSI35016.1 septum site-determining protein MinC [Neisseria dumasiana]UOO84375.1 septum site-determining protein MinC [Neisseria dumasiana]